MVDTLKFEQQIDNLAYVGKQLSSTKASLMFDDTDFIILAAIIIIGIILSLLSSSGIMVIAIISILTYSGGRLYTYHSHQNARQTFIKSEGYKMDEKVDIIDKSYRDLFNDDAIKPVDIKNRLMSEFEHSDKFNKLSADEKHGILDKIKAIDADK